jgi:hypothetical protein
MAGASIAASIVETTVGLTLDRYPEGQYFQVTMIFLALSVFAIIVCGAMILFRNHLTSRLVPLMNQLVARDSRSADHTSHANLSRLSADFEQTKDAVSAAGVQNSYNSTSLDRSVSVAALSMLALAMLVSWASFAWGISRNY